MAARPLQRVILNPLDAAPLTAAVVLDTLAEQLKTIWRDNISSDATVVNLPGARARLNEMTPAT